MLPCACTFVTIPTEGEYKATMTYPQISALINLIDDPDMGVYSHVRQELVSIGESVIPTLENAWETKSFGGGFQGRVEDIIHEIQYQSIGDRLNDWIKNGAQDILEGAMIVARYQYPELDEMWVKDQVAQIRNDVWLEINDSLTAFETVKVLNQVFFTMHGFSGDKQDYHSPKNSFVNDVLDNRKGNPLMLSIIYMKIAQDLGIPVYGVNLPNHYVLAYINKYNLAESIEELEEKSILFYINAFSRGMVFNRAEIESFIKQLKMDMHKDYFLPCSNVVTIRRLLNNLVFSYEKNQELQKAEELGKLRELLTESSVA